MRAFLWCANNYELCGLFDESDPDVPLIWVLAALALIVLIIFKMA